MFSDTAPGSAPQERSDADVLHEWYQFVSHQSGFIGFILRAQRSKSFQTQEQQRAQLGILGEGNEHAWIHLQGMPLPRSGTDFESDVLRIAKHIEQQEMKQHHITVTIDPIALKNLLTMDEEPV